MAGPTPPEPTDPANTPVRRLIEQQLADAAAAWSMGTIGAIAEFVRAPGEPVYRGPNSVVTARGGIRIVLPDDVEAVAYETPAGPGERWNHAVAFCLSPAAARRGARTVLTELGSDGDALRPQDLSGVLFDLGLGTPIVDACVRTTDPELLATLRAAAGQALFETGLAAALAARSPHRVFLTACGRVEVLTPIPPPNGRSPDGPHTHLLPHLLRAGRTRPATAPIPDRLVPCAYLYPAHPASDSAGRPIPFDARRHAAFQRLLVTFGDPVQGAIKAATVAAVRAGDGPDGALVPSDPPGRAALTVALRQLAHTDGPSPALGAWRRRHAPTPDLLDPDGDRDAR